MPEPSHLTAWPRRHSLTALLLVVTVGVDVDVVAITLRGPRNGIGGALLPILAVSQLSLLAWWVTAEPKRWWAVRFAALLCAFILFNYLVTSTDLLVTTAAPPSTEYHWRHIFGILATHTAFVLLLGWFWRLIFSRPKESFVPAKIQFSMLQFLGATMVCAVIAAIIGYSQLLPTSWRSIMKFGSDVMLAVAVPGVLLIGWPRRGSIAGPIIVAITCTLIEIALTRLFNPPYAPPISLATWSAIIAIKNSIPTLFYIAWGLHIWGSKEFPDRALPAADQPQP